MQEKLLLASVRSEQVLSYFFTLDKLLFVTQSDSM